MDYALRDDLSFSGFSFTGRVTDEDLGKGCLEENCLLEEECAEGYLCYTCAKD